MFSFFRRSKKDNEKNRKDAGEKEREEMGKNNRDTDFAPSTPTTSELGSQCKNLANEVSSEVTTLNEKNDSTNEKMSTISPISYSAVLRKPERGSVKPCGHGTTGISPSIPLLSARKNSSTPPPSPKFVGKPIHRQNSAPIPTLEVVAETVLKPSPTSEPEKYVPNCVIVIFLKLF